MSEQSYLIQSSRLKGSVTIPSSKSQTLRAILFASLAQGISHIYSPLASPDAEAMVNACRLLGANIQQISNGYRVEGIAGKVTDALNVIDAGNSGIVLRFIAAVAALGSQPIVITGDASIRSQRPIGPLLLALQQLGVQALSTRNNGFAPIIIQGPMQPGTARFNGSDSQPVSAMLIAAALGAGPTTLLIEHPGELPWVGVTLDWLDRLHLPYQRVSDSHYELFGMGEIAAFDYQVPGDFSSAAFPIAAALITDSELVLENLDFSDRQGDKAVIDVFQQMGARLTIDKASRRLIVHSGALLKGIKVDLNPFIDAIPVLAAVACYAEGETHLYNAQVAREKECDRIAALASELQKLGADVEEERDGLKIRKSRLKGAKVWSYHDHRMVMALTVASLGATGVTEVEDSACVAKTYPSFALAMKAVGASIEERRGR